MSKKFDDVERLTKELAVAKALSKQLMEAIVRHKTEKEAFGLIHSTDDKELWEHLK